MLHFSNAKLIITHEQNQWFLTFHGFWRPFGLKTILRNPYLTDFFASVILQIQRFEQGTLIGGTRTSNWFLNKLGRFRAKKNLIFFSISKTQHD